MKDQYGVDICGPVICPVCKQSASSRPDGSPRAHTRWVYPQNPRLGVVACEGGKKPRVK